MQTYKLPRAAIAAHLTVAATKDVRFYLNGVHLDPARGVLVSTDGSAMLITKHPELKGDAPAFTMPRDMLTAALRQTSKKRESLPLTVEGDKLTLAVDSGTVTGIAYDARYPDYPRVVPTACDGTAGNYDPSLVSQLADALQILGGRRTTQQVRVFQNGPDKAALVMLAADDAVPHVGVVMPVRTTGETLVPAAMVREVLGS